MCRIESSDLATKERRERKMERIYLCAPCDLLRPPTFPLPLLQSLMFTRCLGLARDLTQPWKNPKVARKLASKLGGLTAGCDHSGHIF